MSGQVRRLLLRSLLGRSFGLLFLCPKSGKNGIGVTIGVTERGYILQKKGLHIRVFRGYDRGGGKRNVLSDR